MTTTSTTTRTGPRTVEKLALAGVLIGTFDAVHPVLDQWFQPGFCAEHKDARGAHLVYTFDGLPVGEEKNDRAGWPTTTASRLGWKCAAHHVAIYTIGQTLTAAAVTGALGYRVPLRAHVAAALVNGVTHVVIDRRYPLKWLAGRVKKDKYIEFCQVVRKPDAKEAAETGPGTGLFELDQALHRAIGVFGAVVSTAVTLRAARKGR